MLIARRAFRTAGDPRASLGAGALLVTVPGPRSALLGVLGCPTLPSQWREPTLSPAALLACPLVDVPCLSPTGLGCPSVPQGTPRWHGSAAPSSSGPCRAAGVCRTPRGWGRARPNVRAAAQAVGSGPGSAASRIPISQLSDPIQLCLSVPTGHPGNSTWQGRGPRTGPCPPAPRALRTRPAAHSRAGTEGTQTRPERAPLPFRLCLLQRLPRNSGPA